ERGELRSVPGVGEAIADKTREIIKTGTCDLYERLKTQVPESLTGMLNLPGFGPKKIQTVWKTLGVRDLDELEQAARQQRLRDVPGLGAKTETNLLTSIEAFRKRRERVPIGVALPYAEGLVRMLREAGLFERLEIAGSVRRMKDTVGNIDLVASAPDADAAFDAFAAHAEVREVASRDAGEICVRTHNGFWVDLRVVPPSGFASALRETTGSAEHNAGLRTFIDEQPAGRASSGTVNEADPAETAEEAAIYHALGLSWIPPELREGAGEIEAAAEGRLPRLITADDFRGILHAHSTWSDGAATIERMAATARSLGYAYHGNTDHSKALTVAGGLDEARLLEQVAEIDALNAGYTDGFRILKGIECDILLDGSLDLSIELLDQLDIVIASVHSHQKLDEETMTRRIVRALESGVVDLLAHPTGRILGMRDPYPVDMERVMDAAVANRVALEINAFPDRLDLNEVYARRTRERGIPISVNTDAHRPEHLSLLRYGVAQARRAWLEPEDVLNTWPLDRLMGW
ncbi:MAG TPA: DNA polymerase/3'-5' exonuclease PolX, partial [Armatimonadota bacterium]|nr:DNA polymerase/3'-5' exonuclease PolX [Armatimonadota bacterium]